MNFNKKNIVTLLITALLVFLICIIINQNNTIKTLEENYSNLQIKSFNKFIIQKNKKDNEIEKLESQIVILQERCSTNIKNLLSYIEPLKTLDKKEYLIQHKNILNEYSEIFDLPEEISDYYTEKEINYMQKCIETETYQCDFNSKVNVASVILNRINNKNFPLDPIEIITSENQFAYGRNIITEDTKLALEYAFMIEDTTNGCIAFRSDISPNKWNGWNYQFTDDVLHHFYK